MRKETRVVYLLIIVVLFFAQKVAVAQPIDGSKKISKNLFGLFFEDINYAADGGLYAEMVQNRSFEYNPSEQSTWHPFSYWRYISPGYSIGHISVETKDPLNQNNPHYVVLDAEYIGDKEEFKGEAGVGLINPGFDGMVVRAGEKYNFSVFARELSGKPMTLLLTLQEPGGKTLAKGMLTTASEKWGKYTGHLVANADSDSASLVLLLKNEGQIALDMISLFPEKTFMGRPNGLREDLAQVLADMEPGFLRFPGGCLVHGDGLGNMYRWKNTIGPIEQRVEQRNIWGYHQSAGLGFYEYFQFCEDIGAIPLPVVPAAVCCQNSGGTWRIGGSGQQAIPTLEMPDYIQEVLDLIEWANGPADSEWGSKRAEAGHPEPFGLKYIGVGNEDKISPAFEERFTMIYEAIKKKHPEICIIGTVGPFHSGDDFDKGWNLAKKLDVPMVDEHYYVGPEWFFANHYRYDQYERNSTKVYLGEYASWGNRLWNAIGEASYLIGLERNGDVVSMASYAPLLAKKGFTQWTTDMIFFDNVNICLTPNYYVQKMFMKNHGDLYIDGIVGNEKNDTTLFASCVMDSRTGDIILKIVNSGSVSKSVKIDLLKFKKLSREAELTVLTGDPEAENTFGTPDNILPENSFMKINKEFFYASPAMSLSVLRIKR